MSDTATAQGVRTVPGRSCDGCTMCCKLLEVVTLKKPRHKWCPDCAIGSGCKIYESRPQECRDFYCGWMIDASMPDHWAPRHSRMVLAFNSRQNQVMINVDPDRVDIWHKPPYVDDLHVWARQAMAQGRVLLLRAGRDVWALLPDRPKNLGPVRDDQIAIRITYRTPQGPRYDVIVVEPDDPRVAAAKANTPAVG